MIPLRTHDIINRLTRGWTPNQVDRYAVLIVRILDEQTYLTSGRVMAQVVKRLSPHQSIVLEPDRIRRAVLQALEEIDPFELEKGKYREAAWYAHATVRAMQILRQPK